MQFTNLTQENYTGTVLHAKRFPRINLYYTTNKQISNFLRSSKTNKYTRNIIFGGKMPLNSRNLPISPKKITPAQYCTQKDSPPL